MNFIEGKFLYCNNGNDATDCIGVYYRHVSGMVRVLSISGHKPGEFLDFYERDVSEISLPAIESIFPIGKGITWGIKSAFYVIKEIYHDDKEGWIMKLKNDSGFVNLEIIDTQREDCSFDKCPGILPAYYIGQMMIQNKNQRFRESVFDLSDPPVGEGSDPAVSKEALFEKKFFLVDGHSGCVDVYNGEINIHIKSLSDLEEAQEFINFCIEKGIYK
uniref:Uncharacterized protein n=2 Tax=unclassified Caudoviricetes TaxID=2788787 RepID=A0AAU8HXS0_9CAUD